MTIFLRPYLCHRQRGFTILELLVAFAIMALALGMLYRAAGGSVRSAGNMGAYQRAVILAESLLASHDSVSAEGWSDSGSNAGLDWRIVSEPYSTSIEGAVVPVLHEIRVSISWHDGQKAQQLNLSTLRPQRKPVLVSIGRL